MKTSLSSIAAVSAVALVATASATSASPTSAPAGERIAAESPAAEAHAGLTRDQRIGQLFMVATDADSVDSGLRSAITDEHVGNVILMGRSTTGADHIRSVTTQVQRLTEPAAATGGIPAFVSADQEGGKVQVLRGPGYDEMPTAVEQSAETTDSLRQDAKRWGAQLGRSGVNTNLGPVLDVVPTDNKADNEPIGQFDREYGSDAESVTDKGGAFQDGMAGAGVATTVKHFPGLGRVKGNTDTTKGVKDTVTTADDANLAPFASAVEDDSPFVMMSSATYTKIDADNPAVFSPTVIGSVLRDDVGFDGIVMTDDVGNAKALEDWTPAQRATKFIDAGGDMVLTASTDTLPEMVEGVKSKADSDPDFAKKVDEASLRVLEGKEDAGLLTPRIRPTGTYSGWTTKRVQAWLGREQTGTLDEETIRSLQHRVGAPTTGTWGAQSFRALQTYLGISPDGTTSWDERTVRQLQRYLNTQL